MAIPIIQARTARGRAQALALRDRLRGGGLTASGQGQGDIPEAVAAIIADVARRGDAAVVDWTRRLHGIRPTPRQLWVSPAEIRAAHRAADPAFLRLMRGAAANIRRYQRRIMIQAPAPICAGGRQLGVRYTPLARVAMHVPGGKAAYPSSLLMTVVPAQVAGVGEIVIVTPPGPGGKPRAVVLELAGELGVQRVLCAAGVAALAALAIGTQTIAPVDKIVGPGNAYVTEAKRQLLGRVGIDSTAGPSEVLIIADASARPEWVAADLLAQAEHDPGSAVLVTDSFALAQKVQTAVGQLLPKLQRRAALEKAMAEYSAIIVVGSLAQACQVANDFAPEHLQILTRRPREVLAAIRNAGAIFIGPYTPVPLGDYWAGPSHVLPTGGTARFFSPLSVNDFLKASSLVEYDAAALAADAPKVARFACYEGLTAHAQAVEIRLEKKDRHKDTKSTKK
jgi:histidinol dehydrogenase